MKIDIKIKALIAIAIVSFFILVACQPDDYKNVIGTVDSNQQDTLDTSAQTTPETITTPPETTAPQTTAPPIVTTAKPKTTNKAVTPAVTTKSSAGGSTGGGTTGSGVQPIACTTPEQQAAYAEIVAGIKNYQTKIPITAKITTAELSKIFTIIKSNEYMYVHIPLGYKYEYSPSTGYITAILFLDKYPYTCSQAVGQQATATLQNKVNEIFAGITVGMSDFDKIKYFHDTIIKNCVYNIDAPNAYTAYGALVDGQAGCEGYSKAMALLCNAGGIECIIATGTGNGTSHMWNMLKCNGTWYQMDVTFDDPVGKGFDADYVGYDYFNITTAQISNDHVLLTVLYTSVPSATATGDNYYVKIGAFANSLEEAKAMLKQQLINAANANSDTASIRLSSQTLYNSTYTNLFSNGGLNETIQAVNAAVGNKITSSSYTINDNTPGQNIITLFIKY